MTTPTNMMSKATITCHSAICLERFSLCCGAGSERGRWGIMCRTCGKPFVGGKCGTFDTPPAKGEEWGNEHLDKLIRLSLVTAWELGKKQKDTPYSYNLNTDKLGKPIFDFVCSLRSQAYEEGRKEEDEKEM